MNLYVVVWFVGFLIGLVYTGWRSVTVHMDEEDKVAGFALSIFWPLVFPVSIAAFLFQCVQWLMQLGAYLGRSYYQWKHQRRVP